MGGSRQHTGLDREGLIVLETLERVDDCVEAFPVARCPADAAVDDQPRGILGILEIILQHPQDRFLPPAFAAERGSALCPHHESSRLSLAAVSIPLVALLVPKSPRWLAVRRPADALSKLNRVLARLGMSAMTTLPPQAPRPIAGVWLALFAEGQRRVTALVTSAFLLHITTFYFTLKWIPKIVSDLGLPSASAASVLIWSNVGSLSGGLLVGLLTPRLGLKNLTCGLLLGSALSVAVLGWMPGELTRLIAVCFLIGFCTDGGVVGLFALLARVFPTALRAAGTGFAIGTGRAGAGLGPLFAGLLFEAQSPRPLVTAIMAGGSLLAACALLPLPLRATTEGAPRRLD